MRKLDVVDDNLLLLGGRLEGRSMAVVDGMAFASDCQNPGTNNTFSQFGRCTLPFLASHPLPFQINRNTIINEE